MFRAQLPRSGKSFITRKSHLGLNRMNLQPPAATRTESLTAEERELLFRAGEHYKKRRR